MTFVRLNPAVKRNSTFNNDINNLFKQFDTMLPKAHFHNSFINLFQRLM
jgi:hypothetical protein